MLRVTAQWEFETRPEPNCAACGAPLMPHIPDCLRCGAPAPRGSLEVPRQRDDLTKTPGAIRIAHLSDIHIGFHVGARLRPVAAFRIWLERLQPCDVDVLVVSGDLVERPGDDYGMRLAHAMLCDFTDQWVVVPGNHDIKRPGYHDVFFDIYGDYPRLEHHAGIDFALFDSMAGLPVEERDVAERMYGDYVCYTEGRVGTAQYDALHHALAGRTHPRVAVLHHHLMRQHADLMPHVPRQAGVTEDVFGTMKSLMDAEAFFDWCSAHDVHLALHGHKHTFMQPGLRRGPLVVLNAGTSTLHPDRLPGRLIDVERDGSLLRVINLELVV